MTPDQALKYATAGTSYKEKVELAFPASRDPVDPTNVKMRFILGLVKNNGHNDFEKNVTAIFKLKE